MTTSTALHWFDHARALAPIPQSQPKRSRPGPISAPTQRAPHHALDLSALLVALERLFGYGQVKTELASAGLPFHPYVSVRFVGDVRRSTGGRAPAESL